MTRPILSCWLWRCQFSRNLEIVTFGVQSIPLCVLAIVGLAYPRSEFSSSFQSSCPPQNMQMHRSAPSTQLIKLRKLRWNCTANVWHDMMARYPCGMCELSKCLIWLYAKSNICLMLYEAYIHCGWTASPCKSSWDAPSSPILTTLVGYWCDKPSKRSSGGAWLLQDLNHPGLMILIVHFCFR